jgi:16S rRNA (guanine1207-N2)-methyltransferase
VSNPPFHREFDVNTNVAHRIMRGAKPMLRPGGRLVIVANAFLKYEDVMAQHLTKARVIARSNRFVVIEGRR